MSSPLVELPVQMTPEAYKALRATQDVLELTIAEVVNEAIKLFAAVTGLATAGGGPLTYDLDERSLWIRIEIVPLEGEERETT